VGAERPARLVEKFLTRAFVSVRLFPTKAMDKRTFHNLKSGYKPTGSHGLRQLCVLPVGFSTSEAWNDSEW
jgi:hypothetical protein